MIFRRTRRFQWCQSHQLLIYLKYEKIVLNAEMQFYSYYLSTS